MTKKNALSVAMNALSLVNTDEAREACETIAKMAENLNKTHPLSEEAKVIRNGNRREATAKARAELIAKVAPILREELTHTLMGVTAKELFDLAKNKLPEGFTAPKVQNILLREMKPELVITEAKNKPNTYALISVVG